MKLQPIKLKSKVTKRSVSTGAERWLGKPISCLDKGFVYLVDYLGNDSSIVQAARVSYGAGTKKVHEDRGLIRYLMRHHHTTPFEMVEFKFHAKMPIFVAREWVRHRTASINEYSARYSILLNEFYLPSKKLIGPQSKSNRQGRSDEPLSPSKTRRVLELLLGMFTQGYQAYEEMLKMDLARELARIGLPVAVYTQWYWKINLHNLFHFLRLRMDAHAQYEIRVYANAMAEIVKDVVPLAWEAFEDYNLKEARLSRLEVEIFKKLTHPVSEQWIEEQARLVGMNNKRELAELKGRLRDWGLLKDRGEIEKIVDSLLFKN